MFARFPRDQANRNGGRGWHALNEVKGVMQPPVGVAVAPPLPEVQQELGQQWNCHPISFYRLASFTHRS
jgi:hypothetical protein